MATEEEFISFDVIPSFAPSDITRSTFSRLLKCYPTTIREVYRDKLHIKYRPKRPKRGDPTPPTPKVSEKQVEKELDVFLKLDEWRYEELPGRLKQRAQVDGEERKGIYLEKEEAVQLMDWKVKHGVFRPAILGMVKSNQVPLVRKSTTAAFAALPTVDPAKEPDAAFPQASLDALTGPLRGVGPATASLFLCAGTCPSDSGIQVPFFSDEIYQWLCLDYYPSAEGPQDDDSDDDDDKKKPPPKKGNGELIIKYNLREYRILWNAVLELRDRLNKNAEPDSADEDEKRIFSVVDVEKVAFVLANIDLSGYFGEPTKPRPSLHDVLPPKIKQPKPKNGEGERESKRAAKKRKKKEEKKANKASKRRGRNN